MSDENNFKPTLEGYKPLRPFNLFMKNNFPFIENTFEALDTYGLLCEIVKYLNVVIDNTNTTEQNIESLNNAFTQLNDYVSHYFDNLNVQEEINNKLDEMATTGVLQSIIDNYFTENNTRMYNIESSLHTLESRVDSFTQLEDGSTTADAEIIDARVGNNGFLFPNLGSAIRKQTKYNYDKIDNYFKQTFNVTNNNIWNCAEGTLDETGYYSGNIGESPTSNDSANFKRTSNYISIPDKPTASNYFYIMLSESHQSFTLFLLDEEYKITYRYSLSQGVNYAGINVLLNSQNLPKYALIYTDKNYNGLIYIGWYPNTQANYFEKVNSIKQDFYITQLENTKIVNFGDSLFGNFRGDTSISGYLANNLKNTVYNVGFGGCRMSARNDTTWNAFSMCNLADAIANNNFTMQDTAIADQSWTNKPDYFDDQLALLKSINFNNIDMITIGYGTNDYTAGVTLDNSNNLEDKYTIAGALRYSIRVIQDAFPDLKILVLSNAWRYFPEESNITSDTKTYNGITGLDVKNCILNTAKNLRIPCLDTYENLSLSLYNATNYMVDGVHLDTKGRKLYSDLISGKIKTLY